MNQKYSNNNKKYINNNNNIIDKTKLSMMIMLAGLITFINNACEKEHIINDKTEQNNNNNGNKPNPTPNPQPTPDKTISFKEALELLKRDTEAEQKIALAKIKAEYQKIKNDKFPLSFIFEKEDIRCCNDLNNTLFIKDEKVRRVVCDDHDTQGFKQGCQTSIIFKNKKDLSNLNSADSIIAGLFYFTNLMNHNYTEKNVPLYSKSTFDYTINQEILDLIQTNPTKEQLQEENKNSKAKFVNNFNAFPTKKAILEYILKSTNNPRNENNIDTVKLLLNSNIKLFNSNIGGNGNNGGYSTKPEVLNDINEILKYIARDSIINKTDRKMKQNKR